MRKPPATQSPVSSVIASRSLAKQSPVDQETASPYGLAVTLITRGPLLLLSQNAGKALEPPAG
jgi:hypothetical protein